MNVRTLAALLLLAAAGCTVDNNASVRIANTCTPPEPAASGCTYSATCDSVWMSNLWVDPSYVSPSPDPRDGTLEWPFEVQNQRESNNDRAGGTNTATAFITGYKIHYVVLTGPAGLTIPDVRVDDSSRTVEPGGSTVIMVPVIPRSVATPAARRPAGHGPGRDPGDRSLRRRPGVRDRPVLGGGRHRQRPWYRLRLPSRRHVHLRLPEVGPGGRDHLRVALGTQPSGERQAVLTDRARAGYIRPAS